MENPYAQAAQAAPLQEVPEEESTWIAFKDAWLNLNAADLLGLRSACKNDDRWEELPPKLRGLIHSIAEAARK